MKLKFNRDTKIGLLSLGFSIITTAFGLYPEILQLEPIPSRRLIFFALGALGLLVAIGSFILHLTDRISSWLSSRSIPKSTPDYCTEAELLQVCSLGDSFLSTHSHVDNQELRDRYAINPSIIRCVRRSKGDSNCIVGYFILYPIKSRTERLIRNGQFRTGSKITREHICKTVSRASAIYISMVYAEDPSSKKFIMFMLMDEIKKTLRAHQRISNVYVRPCTEDGEKWVLFFGFVKLFEDMGRWSIYFKDAQSLLRWR